MSELSPEQFLYELDDVTVKYRERAIFENFSIQLPASQNCFVVLGPNGSGKTTFLRLLSGLVKPAQGRVLFSDRDIQAYPCRQLAKHISVMPQSIKWNMPCTVGEALAIGRTPYVNGWQSLGPGDRAAMQNALEQCALTGMETRLVSELSGGEQQRVTLAMALAQETDVLLLDEPTASMDVNHQGVFYSMLLRIITQPKRTVIITTHDINFALMLNGEALVLDRHGSIVQGCLRDLVQQGTLEKIYGDVLTPVTHQGQTYYLNLPKNTNIS